MMVCLIGDLSAAVVVHGMNGEIFCFLPSSSAIAGVGGVRDSVVVGVCMVLDDGFLCEGFGTDGYVMVVFLCIGDRLLCMFSVPSKPTASTTTLVSEATTWCRMLGGVLVDLATTR
jgi:hypothetical protein